MLLADFDFDLPDELIARRPARERAGSRLLVVDTERESFDDRAFVDLPQFLKTGDLLVLNDTRVIKARLRGNKATGGAVEILIERVLGNTAALAHVRASKAPKPSSDLFFDGGCRATVTARDDDLFTLEFSEPLSAYLERFGEVPLPPYLERAPEAADDERYQTVYARHPGAVAAPTAGLHFSSGMLEAFTEQGIAHRFVTLHVGAGTFQTLRQEQVTANRLHSERIEIGAETCAAIRRTRAQGGRIVAVGTTSARVLEAASAEGGITPQAGETDLFIRPGYDFKCVDALLTNFHLPRSSLLMLVSALAGRERMLAAYRHAVESRYRFFSYGDAMLILTAGASR